MNGLFAHPLPAVSVKITGAEGVSFRHSGSDTDYSARWAFLTRFDPMINLWISLVPS